MPRPYRVGGCRVSVSVALLSRDQVEQLPGRAREVVEYRKSGLSLNHIQGCPLTARTASGTPTGCGITGTPRTGGLRRVHAAVPQDLLRRQLRPRSAGLQRARRNRRDLRHLPGGPARPLPAGTPHPHDRATVRGRERCSRGPRPGRRGHQRPAAIVSGLDSEQPRYYLQHALGFQVHDVRYPHCTRQHGRASIGWKETARDD